jgi:hypothetical protein
MNEVKMILENLKKVADKENLNKVFNFSEVAYHKFLFNVAYNFLLFLEEHEKKEFNFEAATVSKISKITRNKITIKLVLRLTAIHFKYFIFSLLFRIFNKRPMKKINRGGIKYIFVSALGRLNIECLYKFSPDDSLYLYMPSANFSYLRKLNRRGDRLIERNKFVINPVTPNFGVLKKLLRYAVQKRVGIERFFEQATGEVKYNTYHKKLYLMLVRQYQAEVIVDEISEKFKDPVIILQNDNGGNLLTLTEELNIRGICNVHIQHGTFFSDNKQFIPPLSDYFFCCSERERRLQINDGVDPKKVFVYGAPLQTIDNSIIQPEKNRPEFDIVIIASRSFKSLTNERLKILIGINRKFRNKSLRLRLDPKDSESEKKKWKKAIPGCVISKNKKLLEDINSAAIVATFSVDTLISCLRQHKKTIFCYEPTRDNEVLYDFMKDKPFIKLASTSDNLIEAIHYFSEIQDETFSGMVDDKFIDYNFGISNKDAINKKIFKKLSEIRKQKQADTTVLN